MMLLRKQRLQGGEGKEAPMLHLLLLLSRLGREAPE